MSSIHQLLGLALANWESIFETTVWLDDVDGRDKSGHDGEGHEFHLLFHPSGSAEGQCVLVVSKALSQSLGAGA